MKIRPETRELLEAARSMANSVFGAMPGRDRLLRAIAAMDAALVEPPKPEPMPEPPHVHKWVHNWGAWGLNYRRCIIKTCDRVECTNPPDEAMQLYLNRDRYASEKWSKTDSSSPPADPPSV